MAAKTYQIVSALEGQRIKAGVGQGRFYRRAAWHREEGSTQR